MQIPDALAPLVDDGIIERVVRPLMSGKEAHVFLVVAQGELRVAKVYKDSQRRTFKHRAEYTEGRKTRNSRDQRAVQKRSKHGRAQDEAAWKSTEIDMIHRLHAGGVRVPTPYAFIDGVLVMECVVDPEGNPAPRLGDLSFDPEGARVIYERILREVVRMLAAGVVHGDLSDFNVLVAGDEPVIIDFPQSVDTAANTNARKLLIRDVDNLHRFLTRYVPRAPRLPYAEEMWELYEKNALTPDTRLTGRYRASERRTSHESVLGLIQDADRDERKRREALGLRGGPRSAPAPAPAPAERRPSSSQPRQPGQRTGQPEVYQHRGPPPSRGPQQPRGPQPSHGPQHSRGPQPSHGPQQARQPGQRTGQPEVYQHRGPPPSRGPQHPRGPQPSQGQQQQPRGPQPSQGQQQQPRGPQPSHGQQQHPRGPHRRPQQPHGRPQPQEPHRPSQTNSGADAPRPQQATNPRPDVDTSRSGQSGPRGRAGSE